MTSIRVGILAGLLLALAGCGGGDLFGGGPSPVTITILSSAGIDGYVRSDGGSSAAGGGPGAGDLEPPNGLNSRMLVSFDLGAIPAGASIDSSTLQVYQRSTNGAPYAQLGNLLVDHVDCGATLDGGDYAGHTLAAGFATLSTTSALEFKSVDVTASVRDDRVAARPRAQFRLRFFTAANHDAGVDFAQFVDGERSAGDPAGREPALVVTYTPP